MSFGLAVEITEENKYLFDSLLGSKQDIEQVFGAELEWMRLDEKKSCRIQFSTKAERLQ